MFQLFDDAFISQTIAGRASIPINIVLKRLALNKRQQTRQTIKSIMVFPQKSKNQDF